MHVDFDHTGIRRDLKDVEPRVERWRVALDDHGCLQRGSGFLNGGHAVKVILQGRRRWHENVQPTVPWLNAERRAPDRSRGFAARRRVGIRRRWQITWAIGETVAHSSSALPRRDDESLARRQRRSRVEGITFDYVRLISCADPREGIQRQTQTHRRIAGDQVAMLAAQKPWAADPAGRAGGGAPLERQRVTDGLVEPLLENLREARAFLLVAQLGLERVHVYGQPALLPQVIPNVLERGHDPPVAAAETLGQRPDKYLGLPCREAVVLRLVGEERLVFPDRLTVLAPIAAKGPARQRFSWIQLALALMQQRAVGEAALEALDQVIGKAALHRAERDGVPLRAIPVVNADKGWLAPHREAHVVPREVGVEAAAKRFNLAPLLLGVRLGDARRLMNARNLHAEAELALAFTHQAADGRRALRIGRRGERDVALAGQQTAGRVKADPARARQIDFTPGVQVGEIARCPAWAVERFHIRLKLDQVAAHKPRGEAKVAQQLAQQPGRVAARAANLCERLCWRLHSGLQANEILDVTP